ncbi:MAG: hypothetical protein ABFC90_01935 [Bacteroidales bacterium]|nr:hypothetical protein [Bacteroidales bacterium]
MTKLEKLYSTIKNLKELGLELGEDLLKQTNELEQEIIKRGIGCCSMWCWLPIQLAS